MFDNVKWLTLPIVILSAFSVHAADMMEHQVPDPSAAITYWTKEKMESAEPMMLRALPVDKSQAFSATTESATALQEASTALQEALTLNEGAPEQLLEGVQQINWYKQKLNKKYRSKHKRSKHKRSKHKRSKHKRSKHKHRATVDLCDDSSSCTMVLPDELRDSSPHIAVGKLFFVLRGFNFVCSASSVTSRGPEGRGNRQTVLTAGHCCNDGGGIFASSALFVPAYDQGEEPYGIWPAQTIAVTPEWNYGQGLAFARDVCVMRTAPGTGEFEGEDLHDVVGALGIKFNKKKPLGKKYAANGYPLNFIDGREPILTLARVRTFDQNVGLPYPIGLDSKQGGGASGGPWLLRYRPDLEQFDHGKHGDRGHKKRKDNIINGVNAYLYQGIQTVYSPYFDRHIYNLLQFVAQQP